MSDGLFVFDGQSLSMTPLDGATYPSQLMGLLNTPHRWVAAAVNGTDYTARAPSVASRVDAFAQQAKKSVLFDDGGTGEILASVSGAALMATVEAYWAARRAAGFDFIVRSTMPNYPTMTGPQDAQRLIFNDLLRASSEPDVIVDWANDVILGDPFEPEMTYDGGHLNATGAARVATITAAAIASIGFT